MVGGLVRGDDSRIIFVTPLESVNESNGAFLHDNPSPKNKSPVAGADGGP